MHVSRSALLVQISEVTSVVRLQASSLLSNKVHYYIQAEIVVWVIIQVQSLRSTGANLNFVVNVGLIRTKPKYRYR